MEQFFLLLKYCKALFEGLIFGGAYVRREICVSKSIGLVCSGKEIYHFALFYFVDYKHLLVSL